MTDLRNKQGKVTPENLEEARLLRQIWDATKDERAARDVASQAAFGAEFGIGNQAAVGFFLNGKTALSLKAAVGFARGLGCAVGDFSPRLAAEVENIASAKTGSAAHIAEEHGTDYEVAQSLSLQKHTVIPTITWWDMKTTKNLPPKFDSAAPDDSMSPRVREGQLVTFDRTLSPKTGDGVLVRDASGMFYLRTYKARRADQWEAHALNPDYLPMESERDGLTVVAVVVGVQARWA